MVMDKKMTEDEKLEEQRREITREALGVLQKKLGFVIKTSREYDAKRIKFRKDQLKLDIDEFADRLRKQGVIE